VLEYLWRAKRFVSGSFIKQKEWVAHETVLLGTKSKSKNSFKNVEGGGKSIWGKIGPGF
jgi:hypothetical protein